MTTFDVITIGRIGVDLYPDESGVTLDRVKKFSPYLGGSPTNVAAGVARLGHSVALISRTGADAFADFLHRCLHELGIDDQWVTPVHGQRTTIAFCELFPPDNFPLYFYSPPDPPDASVSKNEIDLHAIQNSGIFWVSGTSLAREPSRTAVHASLVARGRRPHTIVDLDYRPVFWASVEDARAEMLGALANATVAVGNLNECEVVFATRDPDAIAAGMLATGVTLAIVKMGPEGVVATDAEKTVRIPALPVDVVNGLGAGDAFGGALCHGLLAGWELEATIRFANAAGAFVATRLACAQAMPNEDEVHSMMAG